MALGCDPAGVIRSQSAGGNEAVQMWMELQVLTPGMENGEYTYTCTEMARVPGCPTLYPNATNASPPALAG